MRYLQLSAIALGTLPFAVNARANFFSNMTVRNLDEVTATQQQFTGRDQFIKGYNLLRGNPHEYTLGQHAISDPGRLGLDIFDISKIVPVEADTNEGDEFWLPMGLGLLECERGAMSYATTISNGEKAYQNSLKQSISAGLEYEGFGASFKASATYQEVTKQEGESGHHTFNTITSASACIYGLGWDSSFLTDRSKLPFSTEFEMDLSSVRDQTFDENQRAYFSIFEHYGTHYFKSASFGAYYAQQSSISEKKWREMNAKGIELEAAAEASAWGATASVEAKSDEQRKLEEAFKTATEDRGEIARGASPPSGEEGQVLTKEWIQNARERPQIQNGVVEPLYALFPRDSHFYKEFKNAFDNYCDHLKENKELDSCEAPTEVFATPKPVDALMMNNMKLFVMKIANIDLTPLSEDANNADLYKLWQQMKINALDIFDNGSKSSWVTKTKREFGWIANVYNFGLWYEFFDLLKPLGWDWLNMGMVSLPDPNGWPKIPGDSDSPLHEWQKFAKFYLDPVNNPSLWVMTNDWYYPEYVPERLDIMIWDNFLRYSLGIVKNAKKANSPDAFIWEQLKPEFEAQLRRTLIPRRPFDSDCLFVKYADKGKFAYEPIYEGCNDVNYPNYKS
eukprot:g2366.t1